MLDPMARRLPSLGDGEQRTPPNHPSSLNFHSAADREIKRKRERGQRCWPLGGCGSGVMHVTQCARGRGHSARGPGQGGMTPHVRNGAGEINTGRGGGPLGLRAAVWGQPQLARAAAPVGPGRVVQQSSPWVAAWSPAFTAYVLVIADIAHSAPHHLPLRRPAHGQAHHQAHHSAHHQIPFGLHSSS